MKRRVLFRALFGMALVFTVLFNGCDTLLNGKNATPGGLEGEWEGKSQLGDPVLMIIRGNTITLESLGTKIKGNCEVKDGTINYQPTHIYDDDKKQFVTITAYIEELKKEYLDSFKDLLDAGYINQEEYDEAAANAENQFSMMEEPQIIPYRLEGKNKLILTLEYAGDTILTRR